MLILICGPPGAGKSTVATLLQERLAERGFPFRRLDSDQFARNAYDRMYERVAESDEDWILSGTFYKRVWQDRFTELEDVFVVSLEADLETCLERNRRRPEPIDERGVHVIWRAFEAPTADVSVDVTERPPDEVVAVLLKALEPRLEGL